MQCERPETTGKLLLLLLLLTLLIVVGNSPYTHRGREKTKILHMGLQSFEEEEEEKAVFISVVNTNEILYIKMKLNPTPGTAILYIQTKILHIDAKTR